MLQWRGQKKMDKHMAAGKGHANSIHCWTPKVSIKRTLRAKFSADVTGSILIVPNTEEMIIMSGKKGVSKCYDGNRIAI